MNIQNILRGCPLFMGLSDAALEALAAICTQRSAGADTIVFSEGDAALKFFVLVDGSVDLIKSTAEGKEQLIRSVKKGEVFAEAAMFSGTTYPATAIARATSSLAVITKERFVELVREHPEISMTMIGTMAKLLRHLNRLVSDLSLGSVEQRLARYLIDESKKLGALTFDLPLPKRDLAFKLGTVPETLSRTLKKLASKGAIDVQGKTINISNISELEKIA